MAPRFLHAALILAGIRAACAGPVVDLGYAQYEGVVDTELNITAFRGIRYAASPTAKIEVLEGPLRWQAPTPPSTVAGIQQASDDPLLCIQGSEGTSPSNPFTARDVEQSEDCLFLSVYSPVLNSTKPLPTIVWIPGGGYALGGASFYNGAELVQESNNKVVVVIIQYRLGLFGFLAGEQIKTGGALNAGLLDQDFALRWVNKNIHKFGPDHQPESPPSGDPAQVAIWGQSAGAGSVIQHLVARNGKTSPKLFRAAMTSSTFLPSQYQYNSRVPQALFNEVASQAGCNVTHSLDCLRGVDSATLGDINANIVLADFTGTFTFSPVVDGSFIDILLSVTNTNEGVLFNNQSAEYDVAQYESSPAASLYEPLGSPIDQVNAIMGEWRIRVPPALHGADVINYFPTFEEFGLLFFRANLNPNAKLRPTITPMWRTWAPGAETEMVFNETEFNTPDIAPANTSSALLTRCEFWKSQRYLIGQ
ncbi:Alpha/Beta hydrolase protein [Mycena galopus ATCC 62051]|nr:Alpha/Beta hydrolase protein [Mycena galopus ATCC 62051]